HGVIIGRIVYKFDRRGVGRHGETGQGVDGPRSWPIPVNPYGLLGTGRGGPTAKAFNPAGIVSVDGMADGIGVVARKLHDTAVWLHSSPFVPASIERRLNRGGVVYRAVAHRAEL